MNNHYVLILAGGMGVRLWPLSREAMPKQFLDVLNVGKSLLQITYERYLKFIPKENIFIVTHERFNEILKKQLPDIDEKNILLEPSSKNTLTSIVYGAFKLNDLNSEANIIISPADQMILDQDIFEEEITKALDFTDQIKALVAIGIKPSFPNTNFGYIQQSTIEAVPGIFKVKTFTEKPSLEIAQAFLESGDFLWNSGIFVWRASNILTTLETYLPEMYEVFESETSIFNKEDEKEGIKKIYPFCINSSIDNFIMEKLQNVYVLPATFSWTDIGSWSRVYDTLEKDYLGNAVVGDKIIVIDATQCMVNSNKNKLVVLQGVDDMVIVDTNDVLLICKKNKEYELKHYIAEVKRNYDEKFM